MDENYAMIRPRGTTREPSRRFDRPTSVKLARMKPQAPWSIAISLSCVATSASAQTENIYGLVFGAVFGLASLVVVGSLIWFIRFLLKGKDTRGDERFRDAGSMSESAHRLGE